MSKHGKTTFDASSKPKQDIPAWLGPMDVEGMQELATQGDIYKRRLALAYQGRVVFNKPLTSNFYNWAGVFLDQSRTEIMLGQGQIINQLRYLHFHCKGLPNRDELIERWQGALEKLDEALTAGNDVGRHSVAEYFRWFPRVTASTVQSKPAPAAF